MAQRKTVLSVSVDTTLLPELQAFAKAQERPVSHVVNRAIREHLARNAAAA